MKKFAHGKHSFFQTLVIDPIVGVFVAIVLFIFWILPLPIARAVGRFLGHLTGLVCRQRSRWAMFNLNIAFPKKTQTEKKRIMRQMWAHFGQVAAELPHANRVVQQAEFTGLKYIQQAYRSGKGGFLCSAHFGNWEAPFWNKVAPDFLPNPVFRKANNWFLNQLLFEHRAGVKIPKGRGGSRIMIDLLKKGHFISILCDQKFREGMVIPFWQMPALTPTAMAGLAIKMNLPVIMAKAVYQKGCYHVTFLPPLTFPKSKNRSEAEYQFMLHVNQIYEQWFTQNPEQVLWIHRRFDKRLYP